MGTTTLHIQKSKTQSDRSQLLHCGNLEADQGWFTRGGGTSTASNPKPESQRRKVVIICVLIEHPTEGLILFETGGGENYPEGKPPLPSPHILHLTLTTSSKSGAPL